MITGSKEEIKDYYAWANRKSYQKKKAERIKKQLEYYDKNKERMLARQKAKYWEGKKCIIKN